MDNQLSFYLLLACCPVGIVLSCGWSPVICTNFHHQGISFLIQSVFSMVSVTCLESVCFLSRSWSCPWEFVHVALFGYPVLLFPVRAVSCFNENRWLPFTMVAFVSHLFWCWQGLDKVCSLEQLGCSYTHIRVLSFRISCSLAQKLFTNSAFWTSFPYTVPTLTCHVYFHSANSTQWIAGMGWTQQPIQATSCNYAVCQDGHPNTVQSCPQAHRKGSMNLLLGFITMWHCRLFEATSGI